MPIYEFKCEVCGFVFETLQKMGEDLPPCPKCNSKEVIKLPSIFGFWDKSARRAERERAILKRTRDYLIDGKIKDARRFLEKAKEYHPTDRIKKLSDELAQRKPLKGGFLVKPELVVVKRKERKIKL
ncbi:zinc ribbon domain-containing protein [Candidatus Pacearchaeota archaeon]|nr:MAG: zinc ribbon domain-containing protein [Candidatus Pacearchaeota archaeon]